MIISHCAHSMFNYSSSLDTIHYEEINETKRITSRNISNYI